MLPVQTALAFPAPFLHSFVNLAPSSPVRRQEAAKNAGRRRVNTIWKQFATETIRKSVSRCVTSLLGERGTPDPPDPGTGVACKAVQRVWSLLHAAGRF